MFCFSLGVFIGQNEELLLLHIWLKPMDSEISELNFRVQSIFLVFELSELEIHDFFPREPWAQPSSTAAEMQCTAAATAIEGHLLLAAQKVFILFFDKGCQVAYL